MFQIRNYLNGISVGACLWVSSCLFVDAGRHTPLSMTPLPLQDIMNLWNNRTLKEMR